MRLPACTDLHAHRESDSYSDWRLVNTVVDDDERKFVLNQSEHRFCDTSCSRLEVSLAGCHDDLHRHGYWSGGFGGYLFCACDRL